MLGTFGDAKPDGSDVDDEITFSSRVQLNLDSTFTGEDLLRVRLEAANITTPVESGKTNSLALNFEGDNGNNVEIDDLYYTFAVTERISALVGVNGVDVDDFFDVVPTMGVAYDTLSLFNQNFALISKDNALLLCFLI
ncbi:MAG TPA: hypothetical protein V6C71_16905 [Coleofasciculaceae cyanobacterium]